MIENFTKIRTEYQWKYFDFCVFFSASTYALDFGAVQFHPYRQQNAVGLGRN